MFLIALLLNARTSGQSYYSTDTTQLIQQGTVYDTIVVSNLDNTFINSNFGLDSISLNINCPWASSLVISLIAPDGTMIHLSEQNGGYNGAHYTGTCFDMDAQYLIGELQVPFTGHMRPDNCIGQINNGQPGNGIWQLRVLNKGSAFNSYVINWALHFNNTPAQQMFQSSNLPIVVVNTNHASLGWNYFQDDYKAKVQGTMGIIYNGPGQTNYLTDAFNNFSGNILINCRGSSSIFYPSRSFSVDTKDADWNDTSVALLGMPEEEDWVLYAPWNDKTLIRNLLSFQISNEMGQYAPRTRLCELIFDGDYRGVYVLMENVKRGPDRVAVNKLDSADMSLPDISGGYIVQVDRGYLPDSTCFEVEQLPCPAAANHTIITYEYPKPENINQYQKQYIKGYIDSFAHALANVDYTDPVNGYRHFIDVPSFIDFSISQELANNVDGYKLSSYMYKSRNGKLFAGPLWDFGLGYGAANYNGSYNPTTFRWNQACPDNTPHLLPYWWYEMRKDSTYMQEFRCRYTQLRVAGIVDTGHLGLTIDSLANVLQQAQQRHFNRWPIMGRYIAPQYYVGGTYADEINYLKTWIHDRIVFMDSKFFNDSCLLDTPHMASGTTEKIGIYPNPATDVLHIQATTAISSVRIFNMLGAEVFNLETSSPKCIIHLNELAIPSGAYIVEVHTPATVTRKKIMVAQ